MATALPSAITVRILIARRLGNARCKLVSISWVASLPCSTGTCLRRPIGSNSKSSVTIADRIFASGHSSALMNLTASSFCWSSVIVPLLLWMLVEAGFAFGARFPAAVDPVPVIGMLADYLLERVRVLLRVLAHGGLAIARLLGIEGGQNLDVMMKGVALPHHKRRHHGRAGRYRQTRDAVAGRGGLAEKIHEQTLAHVEVERDRNHPVLSQHPHDLAAARLALDDAVAVAHPLGAYRRVDQRVAQRPMHDREMVAVNGVRYRQQLEISEVRGQHQDAAAVGAALGLVPVFLAFVSDDALDVGAAQLGHVSPFGEHAPPTAIHLAQNVEAGRRRYFGKSDLEVLERDRAAHAIEIHRPSAEPRARPHRALQRHRAQRRGDGGDAGIFDARFDGTDLPGHF